MGNEPKLFQPGDNFAAETSNLGLQQQELRPICIDDIKGALSKYDLTWIWRSDKYEPERKGVRTCLSERDGVGADLKMTFAVVYLGSVTGSKVYFPAEGDSSLVEYLDRQGLTPGGYSVVASFDELYQKAVLADRKVYAVDDLGTGRDLIAGNSQAAMDFVNSKANVKYLAGRFAPPEHIIPVADINADLFNALKPSSGVMYLKTCTGEGGGMGVSRIQSVEQLDAVVKEISSKASPEERVIFQPEITGKNFRFQIFLDPQKPEVTPVVSLTEQIVADDGIRYHGSIPHELSQENLAPLAEAITEFARNIRQRFPEAVGFASCDFFRTDDGQIILFDPALRPTGNTASFMLRLQLQELGVKAAVTDYKKLKLNNPGLPFSAVEEALGDLANIKQVFEKGYGILPWGYNQYQGEGVFMAIAPTAQEAEELWITTHDMLKQRLGR